MKATPRIGLLGVVAAAVLASGSIVGAAAQERSNHANRLEITFSVTRLAIADRPDLGIRQVITSGTGTFEGFGSATEISAVSIDSTARPCGPGSSTSTIMHRIVVPEGTLIVKTLAHRCPTASGGILATGEIQVDGAASTGVFAGAWGSGSETTQVQPPPSGA